VVAVVGVVLALGGYTPLGHLLVHVPLFGSQRLQSRNIALTDLALAVLLSYWVDHVLDRRTVDNRQSAPTRRFGWFEVAALVPLAVAAVLAAAAAVTPARVARLVGADASRASEAVAQRPVLVVSFVLVVVLAVVVTQWGRITPAALVGFLVVFCVADLVFFNIFSVWTVAPRLGEKAVAAASSFAPGTAAAPFQLTQPIGTTGRFVIDDPSSRDETVLHDLGQPDLNLFHHTFSAQGYSSIVDGPYAAATGSHAATGQGTNALSPAALDNGVFDALDTTTLLTLPSALVARPSSSSHTGRRAVVAGGRARWVFGEQIEISWFCGLGPARAAVSPPPPTVRVALEQPGGRLVWQRPTVTPSLGGELDVELPRPSPGVGLVVSSATAGTFGPAVMRTAQGRSYAASGVLQDALATAQWAFDGDRGPLAYYTNERARPLLTLRGVAGAGTGGASIRPRPWCRLPGGWR
jgi:hypothetical protein